MWRGHPGRDPALAGGCAVRAGRPFLPAGVRGKPEMIKLRKRQLGMVQDGWEVYDGPHIGWVRRNRTGTWDAFAAVRGSAIGRQVAWGLPLRREAVAEVVLNREFWPAK